MSMDHHQDHLSSSSFPLRLVPESSSKTMMITPEHVVQQGVENQQLQHDDGATVFSRSKVNEGSNTSSSNNNNDKENKVVFFEEEEEQSESSIDILEEPVLATDTTAEFSNVTRRQQQPNYQNILRQQQQQQEQRQELEEQQQACGEFNFSVIYAEQSFDNVSAYKNDNMSKTNLTVASTMTSPSITSSKTTDKPSQGKTPKATKRNTWSYLWTQIINDYIRKPILLSLLFVTQRSARYPRIVIAVSLLFAIVMAGLGYSNMSIAVDADVVWTPINSKPALHKAWLRDESGFPGQNRAVVMVFHANGENVLNKTTVDAVFEALDAIRTLPDYAAICAESETISDQTGEPDCEIHGVVEFWESSTGQYLESIQTTQDLIETISAEHFANNIPVAENLIFGQAQRNETTRQLTSVVSFTVSLHLPANAAAKEFETDILDTILRMDQKWQDDLNNDQRIAINAGRSIGDEAVRAISADLPLIPLVFVTMSIFTAAVFSKFDKVHSRSFLGLCAVAGVLLSLAATYGMLLTAGIPLTSITQILPFIIFGIGLDDAFIIYGEYRRTDTTKNTEERIQHTVEEIGLSITMTSVTSALAFGLGSLSSIRAARWLAFYGFPAVIMNFAYQVTFFVACIVLDERRIQQNRRDCCCWVTVPLADDEFGDTDEESLAVKPSKETKSQSARGTKQLSRIDSSITDLVSIELGSSTTNIRDLPTLRKMSSMSEEISEDESKDQTQKSENAADRFMAYYARQLLRPPVRAIVIAAFTALLVFAGMSATKLTQEFKYTDLVPNDSYVTEYSRVIDQYTTGSSVVAQIIFRDIDQSDPHVQEEMEKYMSDLVTIDAIKGPPEYCWLTHFHMFKNYFNGMTDMTFEEQIDKFLNNDAFYKLHNRNIARNSVGNITASRCTIAMNNFDYNDVHDQVKALRDQRRVTLEQPINKGKNDWPFFTYVGFYDVWEFYSVVPKELTLVTIIGVASVTGIALMFIPHWTAVLFVLPMICILYVDLLGVMQWAGVHVNGTSFVALSMAIGLLVDFVMHALLSYYEASGDRQEKMISMLSTMGASIFLGGISTCLGTLPLAFCTSEAIRTIFIVFVGLVLLGLTHGLILLPVLLSIVGPEDQIGSSASVLKEKKEDITITRSLQDSFVTTATFPRTPHTLSICMNNIVPPKRSSKFDPPGTPLTNDAPMCAAKRDPEGAKLT